MNAAIHEVCHSQRLRSVSSAAAVGPAEARQVLGGAAVVRQQDEAGEEREARSAAQLDRRFAPSGAGGAQRVAFPMVGPGVPTLRGARTVRAPHQRRPGTFYSSSRHTLAQHVLDQYGGTRHGAA